MMDGGDISLTSGAEIERLCDVAARMGLVQLPLLRAAADGVLAVVRVEDPSASWPSRLIKRNQHRPTCFMIGADPGAAEPDPAPAAWACARRLRDWCRSAIIHGAAGEAHHYRVAAMATVLSRRVAFIETTSARAAAWHAFIRCPNTLLWLPPDGAQHPAPIAREAIQ